MLLLICHLGKFAQLKQIILQMATILLFITAEWYDEGSVRRVRRHTLVPGYCLVFIILPLKEVETVTSDTEFFRFSRKLHRVSMSKSIRLSEGLTVDFRRLSTTAYTLMSGFLMIVSASFLIRESFLQFFSSRFCICICRSLMMKLDGCPGTIFLSDSRLLCSWSILRLSRLISDIWQWLK